MEASDILPLHPATGSMYRKLISRNPPFQSCHCNRGRAPCQGVCSLSGGLKQPRAAAVSLAVVPVDGRDAVQIPSQVKQGRHSGSRSSARRPHRVRLYRSSRHPLALDVWLWPPNHKFVPVTVTGHVFDASGGVPRAVSYHVVDEYGQVQPSSTARVQANGNSFSFVIRLQSSRLGARQGRSEALHDRRFGDKRVGRDRLGDDVRPCTARPRGPRRKRQRWRQQQPRARSWQPRAW